MYAPVNLSLYNYAAHNGLVYVDPTGEVIETIVDVVSAGVGVASLIYHAMTGDYEAAKGDAIGLAVDVAAAIIPGVPGGASIARKVGKGADGIIDAGQVAHQAGNAAGAARQVGNAAEAGFTAARSGGAATSAAPVAQGRAGEEAVRAQVDIGPKASFSINGNNRIADGMTPIALSEVKNNKSQALTRQHRDQMDFADSTFRVYRLWVNRQTKLSGPLEREMSKPMRELIRF